MPAISVNVFPLRIPSAMMRGIVAQNQEVLQIAFLSFSRAYCKHWNPHKQRVRTKPRRRDTAPFQPICNTSRFPRESKPKPRGVPERFVAAILRQARSGNQFTRSRSEISGVNLTPTRHV